MSVPGVIGLVLRSMSLYSDIWNKYFSDFICYKLNLGCPGDDEVSLSSQGDIAQRILHAYFEQLHVHQAPQRLAELHCHICVYQLNLAQMAVLLRPLSRIQKVRKLECKKVCLCVLCVIEHVFLEVSLLNCEFTNG